MVKNSGSSNLRTSSGLIATMKLTVIGSLLFESVNMTASLHTIWLNLVSSIYYSWTSPWKFLSHLKVNFNSTLMLSIEQVSGNVSYLISYNGNL